MLWRTLDCRPGTAIGRCHCQPAEHIDQSVGGCLEEDVCRGSGAGSTFHVGAYPCDSPAGSRVDQALRGYDSILASRGGSEGVIDRQPVQQASLTRSRLLHLGTRATQIAIQTMWNVW